MNSSEHFFNDDPWASISEPCYPEGQRLYLNDSRFWVSIDEDGSLVFFVHEDGVKINRAVNNFAGVNVEIIPYGDYGSRLKCVLTDYDSDLKDKFAIVAKDVAFHCSIYSGKELFSKSLGRIKSWSNFLKAKRLGLSDSEYLGFYGELYIFTKFILREFEPDDAIRFWIGPDSKKQDFTINSFAVDIKSTMVGAANIITISSLDQLEKVTERLYLLRLIFNHATAEVGVTLEDLYRTCITDLENNLEAKSQFLLKTSELYGKASNDQLTKPLLLSSNELYEVADDFPCLKRSQIHSGIVDASYSIYVSRISNFLVGRDIKELIANG
jgi:hypothetical protein